MSAYPESSLDMERRVTMAAHGGLRETPSHFPATPWQGEDDALAGFGAASAVTDGRTRILLIENDISRVDRLGEYLEAAGFIVYSTGTLDEAATLARNYRFDLVVLDPALSGRSEDILVRLSEAHPDMPVIVISATDDLADKIQKFAAGADDYLVRPFHREELLARIHAILRRLQRNSPKSVRIGALTLDLEARRAYVNNRDISLTGKEYSCLELLASRRGMTITKEMFLQHLYGGRNEPEMKIIDVFVCKVRRKLRDAGARNIIETVWGRGYVIRAD